MKLTNSNKTSIGVTRKTLERLTSAKFDFRVNSMEETIEKLLKEHESSQNRRCRHESQDGRPHIPPTPCDSGRNRTHWERKEQQLSCGSMQVPAGWICGNKKKHGLAHKNPA